MLDNRFCELSEEEEEEDDEGKERVEKNKISHKQLVQKVKYYKDREGMYDAEQITYKVLEAIIKELIKEFNETIEKKAKSMQDLRMSKIYVKKELKKTKS